MSVIVEGPLEGEFRRRLIVVEDDKGPSLATELAEAVRTCEGPLQLWIRDVDDASQEIAAGLGFVAYRDLWQLRCSLPRPRSTTQTRAFADDDTADVVAVNNRAFHWHPEQGTLTVDSVRATMREPWFDRDGLRLYHEQGRLVGFCWTKIHADHDPALGEIYVICIDPDSHGRGLGRPMTLAGLEWLADTGLDTAMLYVESDNDPANAVYASIGFTRHQTDRAYRLGGGRQTSPPVRPPGQGPTRSGPSAAY